MQQPRHVPALLQNVLVNVAVEDDLLRVGDLWNGIVKKFARALQLYSEQFAGSYLVMVRRFGISSGFAADVSPIPPMAAPRNGLDVL